MAEKLLIINADDFGFTEGVNEGIVRAHTEGVVTSTSVMVRERVAGDAASLSEHPDLSVGLHFQIADKELEARCRRGERLNPDETAELERDFQSQLEAFTDLTGIEPTHIDGHYSVHMHPDVAPFVERFCEENGIPRRETDATLIRDFFGRDDEGNSDTHRISAESLIRIINGLAEGANELMCHPAVVDDDLKKVTSYVKERQIELDTLTDERVAHRLNQQGVTTVNWTDPRILGQRV